MLLQTGPGWLPVATTLLGTVLGGLISGIVGIVTSGYKAWRNDQAEIVEWHEQVLQRIDYTDEFIEEPGIVDEIDVSVVVQAVDSPDKAVDDLGQFLQVKRGGAPGYIDPSILAQMNRAIGTCEDITRADDTLSEFRKEENDIQQLKQKCKRVTENISTSAWTYLSPL